MFESMKLELERRGERWGRSAQMKNDEAGTEWRSFRNNLCPLRRFRETERIPRGTLHRRHLLYVAESAILPSGIPVPVHENNRQTGNKKQSEGRSTVSAPVSFHSDAIIVLKHRRQRPKKL